MQRSCQGGPYKWLAKSLGFPSAIMKRLVHLSSMTTGTGVALGSVAALLSFYVLKKYIRAKLIHSFTGLYDLISLGSPRVGRRLEGTAVICGGGSVHGIYDFKYALESLKTLR